MNKEQYLDFCNKAESMKVYDGRGTFDLYECRELSTGKSCGHSIITTYADKGVTPFVIPCPKCGLSMSHTRTFRSVPPGTPVIKWVRPTYEQYVKLSPGLKQHVERGGLIMETEL